MRLRTLTDIGVKRRENQDNYWSAILEVDGVEAGVICLCDGMGGLNNGAMASRLVVDAVREYFKSEVDFSGLVDVLHNVNRRIYKLGKEEGFASGTTCTILYCIDGKYEIIHIGDTRCYRLSKDGVEQVSHDHTVIQKYKDHGVDLPEDLKRKYRNTLTRSIGVSEKATLDYLKGNYCYGDIFMVCSDGLWHNVSLDEVLVDRASLDSVVRNCIDKGETDNITVGVLEV